MKLTLSRALGPFKTSHLILTVASVENRRRLPALLIWMAYFAVPNDAGGIVHGLPLGPVEAAALLMLAWLAAIGARVPGATVVAVLLAATFAAGAAIPGQGGFRARYFASAAATGAHERSIEFPADAFTRIDRELNFRVGEREFPLPFFNDNSRFNFYKVGEPNRRLLGFAVRWSGLWWVDDERVRIYIDAPAAFGQIFIDGAEVLSLEPDAGSPAVAEVALTVGWHRLDVAFSSPYGSVRAFSSGILDGDARVPFDASMVVTQQIRGWQMTGARALGRIKTAADVALLGCLAWVFLINLARAVRGFLQPAAPDARPLDYAGKLTQVKWMFAAVAAAEAIVFALPWWRQNMVLVGGDDTMTYEGYARDILFNGILMNGGLPPGQGEPFYYQAFYPYFLAAAHALFGESMFGPVLLQRLLAALAIWKLVDIAVEFASERVWIVALPISAAFVAWKFWPIAAQPLNESLYVPLLVVTAASLIRTCHEPRRRSALASGVLSGLTTITRSTALLAWIIVWPACWLAIKGARHRHSVMVVIVSSTLAVLSLITIRNWIVAGVFAPTSTELGITLLGGNEPPEGVSIDLAPRAAFYREYGISDPTAIVIEYAINRPALFLQNMGRKALFALGFYEPYAPGWGYSPVYIAVWTTALAGLALLLRERRAAPLNAVPYALPALIALTQFVAVVIVYPKGERLIVPIHTLLVPYSALTAWHVLQTVAARMRPRSA
jgi:hypothetical protein